MSIKPNIKWIGSPNFGLPRGTHGRNGYKPIAIVDHIMSGSLTGTDSWFANSASQASSHYGVGKNGDIHQYVDLDDTSWANGIVNKPNWDLLKNGVNPNYYCVTIEHEGYSGDEFTEEQYKSTLALHKWLIERYGLEVNTDTIIGHYRINSVDKANCPGTGFPWVKLFNDLKNNGGSKKVKNLVIYLYPEDEGSAMNLARHLQCPVSFYPKQFTSDLFDLVENIYQVGGSAVNPKVKLITGNDFDDSTVAYLKMVGKI